MATLLSLLSLYVLLSQPPFSTMPSTISNLLLSCLHFLDISSENRARYSCLLFSTGDDPHTSSNHHTLGVLISHESPLHRLASWPWTRGRRDIYKQTPPPTIPSSPPPSPPARSRQLADTLCQQELENRWKHRVRLPSSTNVIGLVHGYRSSS